MSTSSPSSDVPTTAEIFVPLGVTAEQFLSDQVVISALAVLTASIILWDYFNLLPGEYKYYRVAKSSEWRTTAPYTFMILRCAGIVSAIATMCISSFQTQNCVIGLIVSQTAAVVTVAMAGITFGLRALSAWGRNKVASGIVGVTYTFMIASWIVVASQFRIVNGPETILGSNCQFSLIVSWAWLGHGASFIYNLVILVLMLVKLNEHQQKNSQSSTLVKLAYKDSTVLYVSILTAMSITVTIILALSPAYQLVKQVILPFSILITVATGARVYLVHHLLGIPGVSTVSSAQFEIHPATTIASFTAGSEADKTFQLTTLNAPPVPPLPPKSDIDGRFVPSNFAPSPAPQRRHLRSSSSLSLLRPHPESSSPHIPFKHPQHSATPTSRNPNRYPRELLPPPTASASTSPSQYSQGLSPSATPRAPYKLPQGLSAPAASSTSLLLGSSNMNDSSQSLPPPAKVAPTIHSEIVHNAYTVFPDPPSPPKPSQHVLESRTSDDVETPLMKTKFTIPKVGKWNKKKANDDIDSSAWV